MSKITMHFGYDRNSTDSLSESINSFHDYFDLWTKLAKVGILNMIAMMISLKPHSQRKRLTQPM